MTNKGTENNPKSDNEEIIRQFLNLGGLILIMSSRTFPQFHFLLSLSELGLALYNIFRGLYIKRRRPELDSKFNNKIIIFGFVLIGFFILYQFPSPHIKLSNYLIK